MDDILSVAMLNSLDYLPNVARSFLLAETLIRLLSDPVEQRLTWNVLHNMIYVLFIVVSLD